jgi:hypothetical protein
VFSAQIFQENTFLETKPNFPLIGKCFPLTNFPNGKQTQESLESGFSKSEFREINIALVKFIMVNSIGSTWSGQNRANLLYLVWFVILFVKVFWFKGVFGEQLLSLF